MIQKGNRYASVLFVALFLSCFQSVFAQTATFSPYSRYGIGEMLFHGFAWQRAMGGISAGIAEPTHLNFGNPASYAADSVTIFEIGMHGEAVNLSNQTTSQNKLNGNISYLSMGFPLKKQAWYLALGMLPFSAAGYNIRQVTSESSPGNARYFFQGDGGFSRYFAGTGFKLSKSLWAGVNAGYLYGTVNRSSKVEFSESGYLNTRITGSITLSDLYVDAGLMFNRQLKNGKTITAGLSVAPQQSLNAKKDELWVNYFMKSNGTESLRDTISFLEKEKGTFTMPLGITAGFSFSDGDKWKVGFDTRFDQWEKLSVYGTNAGLNNAMSIASGVQYTPDAKSIKYVNRVTYRLGGYVSSPRLAAFTGALGGIFMLGTALENTALQVKSSDIEEGGLSFGFGLPLRGKPYVSHIDITMELSQRGTIEKNLVRERYGRVILGLTLREDWFKKPKFD